MASLYTGRGDKGETDLFSGERVSKDDARIEAYGTVDELNCVLGLALSHLDDEDLQTMVLDIQNDLHIISANLANTNKSSDRPEITGTRIVQMEKEIDQLDDEVPKLTSFILPGGSKGASHLHLARSVSRRAERRAITARNKDDSIDPVNVSYLNRLSDLLFILARAVNFRNGVEERGPEYDG